MNGYHLSPGVEGFWSCHMVQSKLPDPTSSFSIVPPPLNTLLVTTESPTPAPPLSPPMRGIMTDLSSKTLYRTILVSKYYAWIL